MKTQEIFDLAIKLGIENDFRKKSDINNYLKRAKKEYEKLSKEKKKVFDKDRLINPYLDTRILNLPNKNKEIKKILVGVDITSGEISIARKLGIDLVISHHPLGKGLQGLDDVMRMQADVLNMYGVPINVAEGLLQKRISEVARGVHAANSYVAVDAAKLIDMNLISLHTVCDNMVASFIKKSVEKKRPYLVNDVVDILNEIPEYQEAAKRGTAVTVYAGSQNNRTGNIAITEMTGGTEGNPEIYDKMANAGIGTVVAMHQSEKSRKMAQKSHVNVVVAPHIASDSIGLNLFLDNLEAKGIEILSCGGFIRYSRNKKQKNKNVKKAKKQN